MVAIAVIILAALLLLFYSVCRTSSRISRMEEENPWRS